MCTHTSLSFIYKYSEEISWTLTNWDLINSILWFFLSITILFLYRKFFIKHNLNKKSHMFEFLRSLRPWKLWSSQAQTAYMVIRHCLVETGSDIKVRNIFYVRLWSHISFIFVEVIFVNFDISLYQTTVRSFWMVQNQHGSNFISSKVNKISYSTSEILIHYFY